MSSILDKIVSYKRQEIEQRSTIEFCEPKQAPLDFLAALTADEQSHRVSLIAEVKKASPSKGVIRQDFDPVAIAQAYQSGGAACLSVLTDEHFFQGHLDYLKAVRQAVSIPILRKDFILDASQVFEARMAGADAVLLIAECLEPAKLKDLHDLIVELNMTPLVELYDVANLEAVLACNPRLIGVNNRDLKTFEVNLEHSIQLRRQVPDSIAMVSESGIASYEDVQLMQANSIDAILVGESLMRQTDIEKAVRQLMGTGQTESGKRTHQQLDSQDPGHSGSRNFAAPASNEYHEFYAKYVDQVAAERFFDQLVDQPARLQSLLGALPDDVVNELHEPFTWTLKQVVGHLIDGERIFSDRMVRIAVGDQTPIPGMDQQMFVRGVDYGPQRMQNLLDEFAALRRANQLAAQRLSETALARMGTASENPVSARANLFILVGHVEYHLNIIRQRLERLGVTT